MALIISKSNLKIPKIISHIFFFILVITLRLIPSTAELSFILLACYALIGRRQIIEALIFSWFLTFMNYEIVPYTEFEGLGRYLIILSCFISILLRANFAKIDRLTLLTIGLGLFIIIHSIFFSKIPQLSILKALNWTIYITTLLLAWTGMSYSESVETKKWMKYFLLIIIFVSLSLYIYEEIYNLRGIGNKRNLHYFQGILNHPQAFGLTAAGVCAIFIGEFFNKNNNKLFIFLCICICIFSIFISGSRTAGLALFLSLVISIFLLFILNFKKIKLKFNISLNKFLILFSLSLLILTFTFVIQIYEASMSFINKSSVYNNLEVYISENDHVPTISNEFDNIGKTYFKSRSVLIDPMLLNIKENPIIGIGFGLASDPILMNIKYFQGIPISAPIEKGVLPIAIFEEIGFFGLIIFLIWVFVLLKVATNNSFSSMLVILTFLLFNLGEAGLFSPNGFGMLYLIVLTSFLTDYKLIK